MRSTLFELVVDALGQRRLGRGHVDGYFAGFEPGQHTSLLVQQYFFHVLRIADDGNDHVRLLRHFARCFQQRCAQRDQRVGFRCRARKDVQFVTCFDQMAGHGGTHHTDTDEPDAGRRRRC